MIEGWKGKLLDNLQSYFMEINNHPLNRCSSFQWRFTFSSLLLRWALNSDRFHWQLLCLIVALLEALFYLSVSFTVSSDFSRECIDRNILVCLDLSFSHLLMPSFLQLFTGKKKRKKKSVKDKKEKKRMHPRKTWKEL